MFNGMAALVRFGRSSADAPTASAIRKRQMNFRLLGFINNHSPPERVGQTGSLPCSPERPHWRGQGKLPVCPTLAPRFSFFQNVAEIFIFVLQWPSFHRRPAAL